MIKATKAFDKIQYPLLTLKHWKIRKKTILPLVKSIMNQQLKSSQKIYHYPLNCLSQKPSCHTLQLPFLHHPLPISYKVSVYFTYKSYLCLAVMTLVQVTIVCCLCNPISFPVSIPALHLSTSQPLTPHTALSSNLHKAVMVST